MVLNHLLVPVFLVDDFSGLLVPPFQTIDKCTVGDISGENYECMEIDSLCMNNLWASMDYSWIVHRYVLIMHE